MRGREGAFSIFPKNFVPLAVVSPITCKKPPERMEFYAYNAFFSKNAAYVFTASHYLLSRSGFVRAHY